MAVSPQARIFRCLEFAEVDVISCHAFSSDEHMLALCPNNEEIHILRLQAGKEFERMEVETKHTQLVTGLAWSCAGRLVSVSEDRTAFVWDWDEDRSTWISGLVELRAPRAALSVAWAPNGLRFAVGLASKDVAVCHYEDAVQCWVAKKVGRSKAAVTAVAWHPTSQYMATGSTDRRCMVYDVNEDGTSSFGEAQVSEETGSWINAVTFSPTGRVLAFVPQDSTVRFKDLTGGPAAPVEIVRWKRLPLLRATFLDDECLVACGFDCSPVLFRLQAGSWKACGIIDAGPKASPISSKDKRDSFREAHNRFKSMTKEGLDKSESTSAISLHTNTITACNFLGPSRFSTSALDGQIAIWELQS